MIASIIHDDRLEYPDASESFSPSEAYPEYPFGHVATKPNRVYHAVREALAQAGLDAENFGKPTWNPLGAYVRPGNKVFLLCNFVFHRRAHETTAGFYAKCTHGSVIRALADYVYIATGKHGAIRFGNAPLQSCLWDQVLQDTGASVVLDFYARHGAPVESRDLRLFVAPRNALGQITSTREGQDSEATVVRLDRASLLDSLYEEGADVRFRVSDYSPDGTDSRHGLHKHEYIINNEILTSDVVLSVPKLKTHEKVGITVGLKGFVGCVGHKDCLAHHRFGSGKMQGDEYPDDNRLQILLSHFHDFVYRRKYPRSLNSAFEIVDQTMRQIAKKLFRKIRSGAWHGNDTAWRMTVDLAHIMHYADRRGTLAEEPQRKHLVLVDGVIAGEGNGPLAPKPVDCRCLVFSDNVVVGDVVACRLMGYESEKIALIREAERSPRLVEAPGPGGYRCILNKRPIASGDLAPIANHRFVPPDGWRGYL